MADPIVLPDPIKIPPSTIQAADPITNGASGLPTAAFTRKFNDFTNATGSLAAQLNEYLKALQGIKTEVDNNGVTLDDITKQLEEISAALDRDLFSQYLQLLEEVRANADAIRDEGLQRIQDLEKIAETAMTQTANEKIERGERVALDYLNGKPNGSYIVDLVEQTDDMIQTIDLLGAKQDDNLAFILDINKVKVSPTESMAERYSLIEAKIDKGDAAAVQQIQVTANQLRTEVQFTTVGRAEYQENQATLVDQIQLVSDQSSSTADSLRVLGSKTSDGTGFILDMDHVFSNSSQTLAQREQLIDAKFNGTSSSAILSTAQAAADKANATADKLDLLTTSLGSGTAIALDSTKVIVNAATGEVLSTRLVSLQAEVDSKVSDSTFNARVDQRITANVGPGGSYADSILAVQTTANNASNAAANAQAQAFLALDTANGNRANAVLATEVNGTITGLRINGARSEFAVQASTFYIVDPLDLNAKILPFVVTGGKVYAKNIIVQELDAGIVRAEHIVGGAISNCVTFSNFSVVSIPAKSAGGDGPIYDNLWYFDYTVVEPTSNILIDFVMDFESAGGTNSGAVIYLKQNGNTIGWSRMWALGGWGGGFTWGNKIFTRPGAGTHRFSFSGQPTGNTPGSKLNRINVVVTEIKK